MNRRFGSAMFLVSVAVVTVAIVATGAAASAVLTRAEYLTMLNRANRQVTKAETAAQHGLTPEAKPAHVRALILAWGGTETQLGKSFAAVKAPASAAVANALLSAGEIAYGAELKYAANHLPERPSMIGAYLQRMLGRAKGAHTIDQALAKLKAAGYRVGQ